MTGTGDATFTLHVDGDRDERLRRLASGILSLSPNGRIVRAFFSLSGAVFVAVALAIGGDKPIAGVVLAALGAFLIVRCGSRRAAIAQLAARYGHSRFGTEPTTCVLTSTGVRTNSATFEGWWSWHRVAEVRDHEDGLLLAFDDRLWVMDLPPSAFVTVDRHAVARHIAHWITDAATAAPAGAS
jgi:hypothetical protein